VQMPHIEGDGLHHYDVYYIPAVEQQYLKHYEDVSYKFD